MADENLSRVEEKDGQRKVTSISKNESGQIDLTVTTSRAGSNAVTSFRVGVTEDGRVYGTDVTSVSHPERYREMPNGMILSSMPDTVGRLGNDVKPELAAQIREAYQAFKKDGVLDAKEAGAVPEIIEEALQQLPMKKVNTGRGGLE